MTVKEFKDLPGFKDANVAELESIGITTVDQLKEAVNDKAKTKEVIKTLSGVGPKTVENWQKAFASNEAPKATKVAKAEKKEPAAEAKKEEVIDFSKVEIEPLFADQVDFDTFSKSDFRAVKIKACEAVKKSKKLLQFVLDDGTGEDRIILSGIHEYYEPEELVGKTAIAIVNLPPRKMMGLESCGMLLSAVHTEKGEEVLNLIMVDDKIPAGAKLC